MSLQMLIAARVRLNHYTPPATPMTLTGTLPAATEGVAYSGTLTLAGDFTAPVAITGLAAWMTASVTGTTVTITGTPIAATTESLTVTATDSGATPQVATSTQSVLVSAAGGGGMPTLLGVYTGTFDGAEGMQSVSATVPNVQPGDQLIAVCLVNKRSPTASISASDSAGSAYTQQFRVDDATNRAFAVFAATAAAGGTLTITHKNNYSYAAMAVVVYHVRGSYAYNAAASTSLGNGGGYAALKSAPTTLAAGGLMLLVSLYESRTAPITPTSGAGFTAYTGDLLFNNGISGYVGHAQFESGVSNAVFGVTVTGGSGDATTIAAVFEP